MAPISIQNNPNVKRVVSAFQHPQARQLKRGQYHTYKLHYNEYSRDRILCRDPQATQLQRRYLWAML
eukprot:13179123-Ditylum_brightwellii.AAC.1